MKKLLFLLLPFVLFAVDIKFAVSSSISNAQKEYFVKIADAIDEELGIKLIRNLDSKLYEDEAALYGVKNGLIKFAVVKKGLFKELGLLEDGEYGFEKIDLDDDLILVAQSRYFDLIAKNKKEALLKRLKKIKKEKVEF